MIRIINENDNNLQMAMNDYKRRFEIILGTVTNISQLRPAIEKCLRLIDIRYRIRYEEISHSHLIATVIISYISDPLYISISSDMLESDISELIKDITKIYCQRSGMNYEGR